VDRKILDIPRWVELGCVVVALVFAGAVFYPVWRSARLAPPSSSCLSNLKQLAIGEGIYAMEHDDKLPPATLWMDAIEPNVKWPEAFRCPAIGGGEGYGYAMNCTLPAQPTMDFQEPSTAVLLFESVLTARNACSGVYGFPDPPRHNDKNAVAFLDGHVKSFARGAKP
jgi:prepilin-type processing-associated H-X9-DG protein